MHYVALATLPDGRLGYLPVTGPDRDQVTGVPAHTRIHALFTDEQLRAAQVAVEEQEREAALGSQGFAVVLVMADGEAVVRGAVAPTPRQAQELVGTITLDAQGRGPAMNLGAFSRGDLQAMRDTLVSGRMHLQAEQPS